MTEKELIKDKIYNLRKMLLLGEHALKEERVKFIKSEIVRLETELTAF